MGKEEQFKIKLEHFKNLVAVAVADGYWHKNEKKMLSERAQNYGISGEQVKEVIEQAESLKFEIPRNILEREEQLIDAVRMALVDSNFHPKEYELCVHLAERLGFSERSVDQAVELLKSKERGK